MVSIPVTIMRFNQSGIDMMNSPKSSSSNSNTRSTTAIKLAKLRRNERRAEGGIQKWPYCPLPQFHSLSRDTRSEEHIAHRAVTPFNLCSLEFCRQNVGKIFETLRRRNCPEVAILLLHGKASSIASLFYAMPTFQSHSSNCDVIIRTS